VAKSDTFGAPRFSPYRTHGFARIRPLVLTYGFPFLPVAPELCEGTIASGQTKPF
jgi:hypothetical protein